MSQQLKDKIAFVMGAGCSATCWWNGKATALLFAPEGAPVVCVDRDLASAQRTVAIIQGEGGKSEALRADITSFLDIDSAVGDGRHGRIDILQNNVGIAEPGGPEAIDEVSWDRVMSLPKRVLPHLQARASRDGAAGERRHRQCFVGRIDHDDQCADDILLLI